MPSKSYLKWLGNKAKLAAAIRSRLPKYNNYIEPFVGSGALFFDIRPDYALLADANERLVRAHCAVRDSPEDVIALLSTYRYERDFFNAVRERSNIIDAASDAEVAAWLIFLCKTSHGGIYRVNRQNEYNVPFGKYKAPRFCDADKLRACSAALQGASIQCTPFETTMLQAQAGDFVYADPPYVQLSTTSFVGYTSGAFTGAHHARLRDLAIELGRRGVQVLISNSSAPAVYDLYRGTEFHIQEVPVRRCMAVSAKHRNTVNELLISNYGPHSNELMQTG